MADQVDEQGVTAPSEGGTKDASEPAQSAQRRPYVAPKLRYLGKVAELTFGKSIGSQAEAGPKGSNRKSG